MRFFNTTGPVVAADHYHIPPLDRINLAQVRRLIREKRWFVVHAPRQTGKTSALRALQDLLNADGDCHCVYINIEGAQTAKEDVGQVMRTVLSEMARRARIIGDTYLDEVWHDVWTKHGPNSALSEALTNWSQVVAKPIVLLVDEIDSLVGDGLLSVLRQLRAGYDLRPDNYPQSVILCGVRDVRDYRIRSSSTNTVVTGGSAFNVKARSLRLGDFDEREVRALLGQHTEETGQPFEEEAVQAVWTRTRGQPWLVNALAYEACFENEAATDRSRPVTQADILAAREALILRRETHLDQLADKLQEERVRRVVEPLLMGVDRTRGSGRDIEYVRDLGLVATDTPLRIANPIYAEVVPRELTWPTQEELGQDPAWYVDETGGLAMHKLLSALQTFFREHSEHWVERFQYKEAGPQLLLQAFLQRIVNSGGRIEREYGLGRGRTDLLVEWPQGAVGNAPGEGTRKYVVECKVLHAGLDRTVAKGVDQTAKYVDGCDAEEGHLVIFDRREGRSWDERVFQLGRTSESGRPIAVWGM